MPINTRKIIEQIDKKVKEAGGADKLGIGGVKIKLNASGFLNANTEAKGNDTSNAYTEAKGNDTSNANTEAKGKEKN